MYGGELMHDGMVFIGGGYMRPGGGYMRPEGAGVRRPRSARAGRMPGAPTLR